MFTFPTAPRFIQSIGLALVVGLGVMGCQPVEEQDGSLSQEPPVEAMDITVSILPQQYFLEKIGGDLVRVSVLVPGNSDPHTYEPKPQQLAALSEAEAYVLIGLGFEQPWLEKLKAANANMKLIDSAQGITPLEMEEHNHSHGEKEGEKEGHSHDDHDHGSESEREQAMGAVMVVDPHIWLSPTLVKQQASTIAKGLAELDPENREQYEANLSTFLAELEQLDQELRQVLELLPQRKFIVFHPSWAYFARDYNLEQIPIEVEGQEPSARELKQLIDTAKENSLTVVFGETQFSTKSSEAIAAEIGAGVELLDPLAADWSSNLKSVAQKIANANSPQP
ncbi:zinc ABC transporter substrate-binding protein [Synechocystis sp. PCC 7339]|uniref:metal ABC transporter solute-binding protein, Zn/Mn family n=1 Tax=unclassified Synechocystis TaxID=2640012 RepID=UPI001BAF787F|nr:MULTISPECIES: zinc ABC transporter substrate-binding protein [unclassified Synechocystis]QUS61884.1 zinc ABC transporter substrate-binding protein [Synechocystis sp. PCC 7338]UAJ74079.1 zinc ABC transporter substrate-binding protein [Synechocystis sp. PCC 7339]